MPPNEGLTGTTASRLRRATDAGSRRSGARAAFFALVAIGASIGAAILIMRYVDSRTVATPTAQVMVAAIDLSLATTLRPEHVKAVDWPAHARPGGSFSDGKPLVGRVLTSKLMQGEPILESRLAAKDSGAGLAALIPPTMRAVAVRVDDVVGVAGFIHPEDRVDVIVTMRPAKPADSEPTSKVILQNVKVLTVGKELEVKEGARGQALPVTVATLLVDPEQAEKLALSANQGQILLTLRSWSDSDAITTTGMVPSLLLADTAPNVPRDAPAPTHRRAGRKEAPAVVAQAPAVTPPPVPKKDVVEILRGDRFEERKFDQKEKP